MNKSSLNKPEDNEFHMYKMYVQCLCWIQSVQFGLKSTYNHDDQWIPAILKSCSNLPVHVIHDHDLSDLTKIDKWDNLTYNMWISWKSKVVT